MLSLQDRPTEYAEYCEICLVEKKTEKAKVKAKKTRQKEKRTP